MIMPKMKTNSGARKRFRIRASGSVKRKQSHRSHILTKKSTKRKRHLRHTTGLDKGDTVLVSKMLPNG